MNLFCNNNFDVQGVNIVVTSSHVPLFLIAIFSQWPETYHSYTIKDQMTYFYSLHYFSEVVRKVHKLNGIMMQLCLLKMTPSREMF